MTLDIFQENIQTTGMLNNFLLLTAMGLGLYLEKKREGIENGTAMSDIKNALRAGAPYVLIVSAFMYFYYDTIHPEFVDNQVEQRMDMIYADMERPSYVDSLKMHNSEFQVLTDEEILRKAKIEIESNLAPKSMFTFSLLGLLVLAVSYAILLTLIFRKLLFKEYYPND